MVLPLCYCARPRVGAATLNYHRDGKIHQGHICCVSSALLVLHDPCGVVVVLRVLHDPCGVVVVLW